VDKLLLLYLIGETNKKDSMDGNFKLQKLPFLAELGMFKERLKGFNYTFFRYLWGPMTKEIYKDKDTLVQNGFIVSSRTIKLTPRGNSVVSDFYDVLNSKQNLEFKEKIDEVVDKFARYSFDSLKRYVYNIKLAPVDIPDKELRIEDIPIGYDIIVPLTGEESKKTFFIEDNYLESFHLSIISSLEDLEESRIISASKCFELSYGL
jgi:uncharacterized phage-associated protein